MQRSPCEMMALLQTSLQVKNASLGDNAVVGHADISAFKMQSNAVITN